MRNWRWIILFLVMFGVVGCNQGEGSPLLDDVVRGVETAVAGETPVSPASEAPQAQVTPTPPLPATYTPPARFLGEHLYLLPVAGAAGTRAIHVVQPGETAQSISEHYGMAVDTLLANNGLTAAEQITPGMALIIP